MLRLEASSMHNPHEKEVENIKVRVRCPECRTMFHARMNRVIHGDVIMCPTCENEMSFHNIGHIHEHETVADFIHHVEQHTRRPHFYSD
jgi:hydrogenase maturation factor HypF (carbamoyltransferase family)